MSRREPAPTCSLCGQQMFWDMGGEAWQQPGWACDCDAEPEERAECPSCGYDGPVGGACDNCAGEIGS